MLFETNDNDDDWVNFEQIFHKSPHPHSHTHTRGKKLTNDIFTAPSMCVRVWVGIVLNHNWAKIYI